MERASNVVMQLSHLYITSSFTKMSYLVLLQKMSFPLPDTSYDEDANFGNSAVI